MAPKLFKPLGVGHWSKTTSCVLKELFFQTDNARPNAEVHATAPDPNIVRKQDLTVVYSTAGTPGRNTDVVPDQLQKVKVNSYRTYGGTAGSVWFTTHHSVCCPYERHQNRILAEIPASTANVHFLQKRRRRDLRGGKLPRLHGVGW